MSKILKIILSLTLIPFFYYIFASIRVSKSLNKDDFEIINLLNLEKNCSNLNSYEKEVTCIKSVQTGQLDLIKGKACRGKYINLGSKEVITTNTACCYDRSRIIEQTLQYYGFKVRHVHLNVVSKFGYLNLLVPNTYSHAATEVLTSKGWLGVDSTEPFLLIGTDNIPKTYKEAITSGLISNFSKEPIYYKKSLTYVIGLYSKNGTFFEPFLPYVPEINIIDFVSNFPDIKILKPKINTL